MCETCRKNTPTIEIGFTNGTGGRFCNGCATEILDQYRQMGKPGQIILRPVGSEP